MGSLFRQRKRMRISIQEAIFRLNHGEVVALPTETVYGLAAALSQPLAIESIFQLKKRPASNPLIVHLADASDLFSWIQTPSLPPQTEALMHSFWPGPLTLVMPALQEKVPSCARSGLPTVGFRVPSHELTSAILRKTGPLVMPSANLSGHPSSTHPFHVEEDFGLDFPVVDGGACSKGLESTILLFYEEKWQLGRLGAIPPEALSAVLGYVPLSSHHSVPLCPGMAFRHYAPKAELFLNKEELFKSQCAIIGFKERSYPSGHPLFLLGSLNDAAEVAENLYQVLRSLDQKGVPSAWVDLDFPQDGIWCTIRERLKRALQVLTKDG